LDKTTIFGKEIQNLRRLTEAGNFADGQGTEEKYDIITPYSNYLVENISIDRPVKVAMDAGNGTGGVVAGPILKRLGCRTRELFFDMDGRFPNHEPDPTVPANMRTLADLVVREGLELGIGFDGDTDRIGIVDEKGRLMFGDMLMVIFAREILKEHPGAAFVGEVKCSQNMYNDIQARGGRAVMWKAGHSLIKNKLKEEKGLLAAEMSGHIFFAHRYFGFDDAIYAACRLLEIVAERQEPLSEFLADLPPVVNTPEIRVNCPDEHKFALVQRVRDALAPHYEIIDIDGLRVVFPDGWGLLRASNTGPVLVMRFEAQNQERLEEIRNLVEGTLNRLKAEL
jgi:phosphomannomutase/phosphoglucomutase